MLNLRKSIIYCFDRSTGKYDLLFFRANYNLYYNRNISSGFWF